LYFNKYQAEEMRSGIFITVIIAAVILSCSPDNRKMITFDSLLKEMTDLERLTYSEDTYRTFQYSSYDRRSKSPSDSGWFANEDGFGNEPIPGFEKVLQEPDSTGVGVYLICDIKGPGVIQRLWSAGITGSIRLYIDNPNAPMYEGEAKNLFHNVIDALAPGETDIDPVGTIRQFDASYFPVPFSESCRLEWIGNISELHFYHVGFRTYKNGTRVESFRTADLTGLNSSLEDVIDKLWNPDKNKEYDELITNESSLKAGEKKEIMKLKGEKAVKYFSVRIKASDVENVLRKCILTITFDNSSVPQIQAPIGDFFGAAPGVNYYTSLPFTVQKDSTMICRFVMPFRSELEIVVDNKSEEEIKMNYSVSLADYEWEQGRSMHFRCRWKIDHDLTASNINMPGNDVSDIIYLMADGRGRIVGASALLYNPTNAPVSWGNWWGEGDEKIFIDADTFPSYFGTGSEDYFNYSWSSATIVSFAYCGQPRNDGPGNRGYVSDYRWHIFDDIPFNSNIAFYMELGHHGKVPGFHYGRIIYYYAQPGTIDDFMEISDSDIREVSYEPWLPEAYLGSAGYKFIQAENMTVKGTGIRTIENNFSAGKRMIMWIPKQNSQTIDFNVSMPESAESKNFGFTLLHIPEGGKISVYLNEKKVKINGSEFIDLATSGYSALDNHISEKVNFASGVNKITLKAENCVDRKIGVDFVWIRQ
jgi:hypothetical protein